MKPDLEALLRAYEAVHEAGGAQVEAKRAFYESLIEEVSERTGVSPGSLHGAVSARLPSWIRANSRPPTLPPKA